MLPRGDFAAPGTWRGSQSDAAPSAPAGWAHFWQASLALPSWGSCLNQGKGAVPGFIGTVVLLIQAGLQHRRVLSDVNVGVTSL